MFCVPSMLANLLTNPDVYSWQPATDQLSRWLATAYKREIARTAQDYNGLYAPTTGATYDNAINHALQTAMREKAMRSVGGVEDLALATSPEQYRSMLAAAEREQTKYNGPRRHRAKGGKKRGKKGKR